MSRDSVNKWRTDNGYKVIEELPLAELLQLLKEKYAISGSPRASKEINDIWVECEIELLARNIRLKTENKELSKWKDGIEQAWRDQYDMVDFAGKCVAKGLLNWP